MKIIKITKILRTVALCLAIGVSGNALANSGSKEASAAGAAATARLEPFVVNLSDSDRYLQVIVTLQIASGEVGEKIKMYMPIIRHKLILILSDKESARIQSIAGKQDLMEEIKYSVNKALELKEHDGVTDIFFENFVIQ